MKGIYVARLCPLRKHLPVVDPDEGAIYEYFDDCCFALERKHPERVAFLIDHDPRRVAGRFHAITTCRGWLIGGFQLDDNEHGAYAAERLKYGTPISIGFDPELSPELGQSGTFHRQVARLNEASLVDRAAYRGAEIMSIVSKRTAKASSAAVLSSGLPAAGEQVIYGKPGETIIRPGIGQVLGVR